ncbi:hypothetical protein D3C80_1456930 [compost metagenome]
MQQADAGRQVGEVVLDQVQVRVGVNAQLLDAPEVNRAGTTIGAIDCIALFQQQFRQVGAVLTSDPSNDCFHAT